MANLATGMAYGVFVLYGKVTLGLSPGAYGLLLACEAVGGLVAGPLITRMHRPVGHRPGTARRPGGPND